MVRIGVDLGKRDFVWIGLIIVLLSVGFGVAYTNAIPDNGHGGDTIWVDLNGTERTLQSAVNLLASGAIGGGTGGGSPSVDLGDCNVVKSIFSRSDFDKNAASTVYCPQDYVVAGFIESDGHDSSDNDRHAIICCALIGGGSSSSQQVSKTTISSTASLTYEDLPGMSMDVTTDGGNLLIMFNAMASSVSGGETYVRLLIDGTEKALGGSGHTVQGKGSDTVTVNWLETALPAGTYNIKMQWKVSDQTSYIPRSNTGATATATLIAVEL